MDIPFFWINLLIWVGSMMSIAWIMDLDLMRERSRVGAGIRGKLRQVLGLPMLASHFIVAGLDVGRFHWSDTVPLGLQVVSSGGIALGFALLAWTMLVNPFFAKEIRIQEERGHEIITSGPYGHIRHPGYAGFAVLFLMSGLGLGSWFSFILGAGFVLYFVWRTVVEDRFMQENLEGYADYVGRVPYRLIPGLW
jgi:protein-S-isoprenylcysteine O-methyltransferase Ste14